MKMKTSQWTFLAAVLFTINALYWYVRHPDDVIGIIIYGMVALLFYVATIGNRIHNN